MFYEGVYFQLHLVLTYYNGWWYWDFELVGEIRLCICPVNLVNTIGCNYFVRTIAG